MNREQSITPKPAYRKIQVEVVAEVNSKNPAKIMKNKGPLV